MLGEKRIISFSPELGTTDRNTETFYPSINSIVDVVLKNNLPSALYGIQRAAYYLKMVNLKKIYVDCKLIKQFEHKYILKDTEELEEERQCRDGLYQFTNSIAIKNFGFSDFKGKLNLTLNITSEDIEYISINLKRENTLLFKWDKNYTTLNDTYINSTGGRKLYNDKEVQMNISNIDNDNQLVMNIRFYVDKNKLNNTTMNNIIHQINTLGDNDNILKYNLPEFKIKFNEFELVDVKDINHNPNTVAANDNIKIILYIFIGIITLLIVLLILVFRKIKTHFSPDEQTSVVGEAGDVNLNVTRATIINPNPNNASYIQLSRFSRSDF